MTVKNALEMIECYGAYNLTGEDDSVVDYFETSSDFVVIRNHGIHDSIIVIAAPKK